MKPIISVVLSTKDDEQFIEEAVSSILNQTFTDFEFLICDDGSTDKTGTILKRYATKDKRIRLFTHQKSQGIPKSVNELISYAKGKYIARMDGDDVALPKRFKLQVDFLEKNPTASIVGSWVKIIPTERVLKYPAESDKAKKMLWYTACFCNPATMMRKSMLEKLPHVYNIKYPVCQDYDLWFRLSHISEFGNIPKVLLLYRKHVKNISNVQLMNAAIETILIKKKQKNKPIYVLLQIAFFKVCINFVPRKIRKWWYEENWLRKLLRQLIFH